MHELKHEFTDRKISPWGGLKFFHGTYQKSGIREYLSKLPIPYPGSNRGYNPLDLIEAFMVGVVLGSRRLSHTGLLRTNQVIQEIFDWKKGIGAQSTFSRFFNKFDLEINDQVFPELMKAWFRQVPLDRMTIDIDSTIITRYGEPEGAEVGYNPKKPGRKSHHPIMAFCDEVAMVINAWMRTRDSVSVTDAEDFIEELLTIVAPEKIGLIRFDSGFFSDKIMNKLENPSTNVNYIIRAKMTAGIRSLIQGQRKWIANDDVVRGAQYTRARYRAKGWGQERDVIIVRIPLREKSPGQKAIFEIDEEFDRYEYRVLFTTLPLSGPNIHKLYNQRGDAENRIKELKYDYGMDGFSLKNLGAMEAAFRFVMVAYNIMAAFKQWVMLTQKGKRLATIKFQCIAIGSYLIKSGRKKVLKLSAEGKRRHFLEHFFENLEKLAPPFQFSNA